MVPGATRGPNVPPVDLGQTKFLNFLFVKPKVCDIYYFIINSYQISKSFLNG